MSINKIYDNLNKIEIEAEGLVFRILKSLYTSALSKERKIGKESEVISFIESLEHLEYLDLTEFDRLESEDLQKIENIIKYSINLNGFRSDFLNEQFLLIANQSKVKIESLIGKLKRIKQKRAALDLWDDEYIKFAICEKFINYDSLEFSLVPSPNLNVNTSQGVLTLPVETETNNKIRSLKISSGNGSPGNSDMEITFNNINLSNIVDEDPNTWFEYEKLDRGPVELGITINLAKEEIVNKIEIEPLDNENYFEIKDILFSGNEEEYKSVKAISVVENESFFFPKELDGEGVWSISFMPVSAKNIIIVFENSDEEYIKAKGENETYLRKRYTIGLKNIYIKKVKYKSYGAINSSPIELLANCYVGDCKIKTLPETEKLFETRIDVSTDGGVNWQTNIKAGTISVEDNQVFLYKMFINRKNDKFATVSSFKDIEEVYELKSAKKTVSKNISPNIISISDRVSSEDIFVFQETKMRKTNSINESKRFARVNILNPKIFGHVSSSDEFLRKPLPKDFEDLEIENEEIQIYVNNVLWSELNSEDLLVVGDNTYVLDREENRVVFLKDNVDFKSTITWKMKPDEVVFEKKRNGFYGRFRNIFNPNKGSVNVKYTESVEKNFVETIRGKRRRVRLRRKGVIKESIVIEDSGTNPITFTMVSEKKDVDVLSNTSYTFYFDEKNSVLIFPQAIDRDSILRVRYRCKPIHKLEDEMYSFWFEEGEPKGIIIKDENFTSEDSEQTLYVGTGPTRRRFSQREGTSFVRNNIYQDSKKSFVLEDRNIIRGSFKVSPDIFGVQQGTLEHIMKPVEVTYIDGVSEFLGLKNIENELTNSIDADSNGIVEFVLAAGNYIYLEVPVVFESGQFVSLANSFLDVTSSVGNYYVNEEGIVRVNIGVGNTLEKDTNISYSYQDPSINHDYSYSVDYRNGYFFISRDPGLNIGDKLGVVSYKTCDYIANYDIVNKV